jgi:ketol-acid reductoisomerase
MDRLSNPAKIKAFELAEELRGPDAPAVQEAPGRHHHGLFSTTMMKDWDAGDVNLLGWRAATNDTAFEQTPAGAVKISEQEYYDHAVLMVAMVKAGVELAFECMVEVGMKPESAYYESLHETPLIANLISRKKLYEMNKVISDTAEYGCYLFSHAAVPLLKDFVARQPVDVIGKPFAPGVQQVDNRRLLTVNQATEAHPVEKVGATLRGHMTAMKQIAVGG